MPFPKDKTTVPIETAPLTNVNAQNTAEVENVYRDPKTGIVFLVNVLASFAFGITCMVLSDWSILKFKHDSSGTEVAEAIGITGFCIVSSVGLSYVSLWAAEKYTRCLLYTGGVLMIIMTVVFYILSGSFLTIIMGVIMVGFYIYFLTRKDSIAFAIWVVQTSCKVIHEYGGTVPFAFLWLIVQTAWLVLYVVFAIAGGITYGGLCQLYFVFSLYWGAEVLSNILTVTVSSLSALWATGVAHINPEKPVNSSFKFSITYAFGSICLGSLIVGILKTIRLVARTIATQESSNDNEWARVVSCCCICFLSLLENIIQYFNEWAYAYIAMYRNDFCTSGKMVWDLWTKRGLEAMSNDMYTDMVTLVPPIVVGLFVAGLYGLCAKFMAQWDSSAVEIGVVAGGVIGFILCNMVMRLVGTAQNVIFLSYLEQRESFKGKHKTLVDSLESKFQTRYPKLFQSKV